MHKNVKFLKNVIYLTFGIILSMSMKRQSITIEFILLFMMHYFIIFFSAFLFREILRFKVKIASFLKLYIYHLLFSFTIFLSSVVL